MRASRLSAAVIFASCIAVGTVAGPVRAAEPPATGDLFDVARGATVTSDSGVNSSIIESLFGATGVGPEPTAVFFNDAPAGTVHFVEWSTSAPITLSGFNLHAAGDVPGSPEKRAFEHFRLQAKVGEAFQTIYDADVTVPYAFLDGQSSLVVSSSVATTTAQEFRAELTQHLEGQFYGPRVIELDGFPTASCGDANYSGAVTATDSLIGLQTGVGAAGCPGCICDINGNGSTTATDALAMLQVSVGVPVPLACAPCFLSGSTTTTTLSGGTTTTTLIGPTTTTTATTSTTVIIIDDLCEIDTSTCTVSPCTCGENAGLDYHLGATGRVSGPEGSELHVNISVAQGGVIDCGGWTRIFGADRIGCDIIGCCRRDPGNPLVADWNVFEAFDLSCVCPSMAGLLHNFLLQCLPEGGGVTEVEQTTDPCP
jgi:hypothetical protein